MRALKKSIWPLTGLLIVTPFFVYALVQWYQARFSKLPVFGDTMLTENSQLLHHKTDGFEFKNQDGKIFSSIELKDKIFVVNFFFTSCPTVCTNMMKHMKEVQEEFANDGRVDFVSFTVDPERDDVARLKWYAGQHDLNLSNWNLLTGDKREIYKLARKSFYLTAADGNGGENDFIHSDQLVLVDTHKQIRGYYKGTDDESVERLKKDIKKLENEK
ncbi:MAG TPA: SCO family protein [Puia sp.]|nr:SCO family protein [Puia sp.]